MNEMNEKQTKIYNNIIEFLESGEIIFLGGRYLRGYVRGYVFAMIDSGKLTANEAFQVYLEVEDALDEMLEREGIKND